MNHDKLLLQTLQVEKKTLERRIEALEECPKNGITKTLKALDMASLEVVIEELKRIDKPEEYYTNAAMC